MNKENNDISLDKIVDMIKQDELFLPFMFVMTYKCDVEAVEIDKNTSADDLMKQMEQLKALNAMVIAYNKHGKIQMYSMKLNQDEAKATN